MKLPRLYDWPKAEADVPVKRALLSVEQEQRIQSLLRFPNPEFFKALNSGQNVEGLARYIFAYERYTGMYRLPRHAPWGKLGLQAPRLSVPTTDTLPWEFTGTLRDNQQAAFLALRDQLIYHKDGILVLSCGKGKTVLATAGFGWQQRPALAVVTQLFIAQQWKKALLEFTNIPAERIGMIGDGAAEWDKDFVIATIQTLAQKDFPADFYRRFGLVFYDECHRLGAQFFGRVAPMFTGVRIGLTATLERADRMQDLFMLHLGRVFYEDKEQQLVPRVYFRKTPVNKDVKGFRYRGKLNTAKLVTHLSRLENRRAFVVDLIRKSQKKDRKVLVLSERKEELKALHELCGPTSAICVGSLDGKHMKQETKEAALDHPIILATSQLVKEALDKKEIDTLIIEYPQSSESFSEQSTGRILRLDDDKREPVILVLMDSGCYYEDGTGKKHRPFKAKCVAMERTFKRLGYDIVEGVA
jgi:superfamily II DNA or RNA helicase